MQFLLLSKATSETSDSDLAMAASNVAPSGEWAGCSIRYDGQYFTYSLPVWGSGGSSKTMFNWTTRVTNRISIRSAVFLQGSDVWQPRHHATRSLVIIGRIMLQSITMLLTLTNVILLVADLDSRPICSRPRLQGPKTRDLQVCLKARGSTSVLPRPPWQQQWIHTQPDFLLDFTNLGFRLCSCCPTVANCVLLGSVFQHFMLQHGRWDMVTSLSSDEKF